MTANFEAANLETVNLEAKGHKDSNSGDSSLRGFGSFGPIFLILLP